MYYDLLCTFQQYKYNSACTQSPGIPRELTLPDLSIQHYQLVFLNGRSDQQIVQMCAGQLCSHTHSGSAGASSEGYSVAVAAQNMVGLGDTRNCTSQPISKLHYLLPQYLYYTTLLTATILIYECGDYSNSAHIVHINFLHHILLQLCSRASTHILSRSRGEYFLMTVT